MITYGSLKEMYEEMRSVDELVWRRLESPHWALDGDLKAKVNEDGRFKEFVGDTVVIPLLKEDIEIMEKFQIPFYERYEEILAEKIDPKTFHVTIHDLSNPYNALGNLEDNISRNERMCKEIFKEFQEFKNKSIELEVVGLVGGKVAIGLGFVPTTEEGFELLKYLHEVFEKVVKLDYPFHPHVTLFYFKPIDPPSDLMSSFGKTLREIGEKAKGTKIRLKLSALAYQRFTDMNHYETIFSLGEI